MKKDLEANWKENFKKSSVAGLVNYDIKTDFSKEISKGVNTEWNKCNENLSEGNKLNRKADFKFDSLEPWEKICCYQIAPDTFDCDVSLRNMIIYGIVFPFVLENRKRELQEDYNKDKLKYCFHSDDDKIFEYRGDTMNSYNTTVHKWILSYPNHSKSVKEFLLDKDWGKYKKYQWEAYILDNYEYFDNILPTEAKELIRLNHTMGNFIPVPKNFNPDRYGSTKDYWDLTLLKIYNYLHGKKDDAKWLDKYEDWLNNFNKDWDMFVEKNFLQDFVNYDSEANKYGRPKELWKGHFTGCVLPETEDDFSQFFINASACITARGTRMAIELKNKLDKWTS